MSCFRAWRFPVVLAFVLSVAAGADAARAQSLTARGGLGLIAEPLDARARGLGGVGLGLPEANLSLINPAGIAGIAAPALHVTYQPDHYSTEFSGQAVSGTTSRFPLIHIALPLGERWAVSLGYGSLLDQSWAAEELDSLDLGGETITVLDRRATRGGIARLRLGAAYNLNERLALGLGIDIHTGSARDTTVRFFQSGGLQPAGSEIVRNYSGTSYVAGARWTPSEAVTLGAALSIGGSLEAETQDSIGAVRQYDLPVTASFGASAQVAANTIVALSTDWKGWSSAGDALSGVGGAQDTWTVAGGVEWDAISVGDRVFPIRIGGRFATLPFQWIPAGGEGGWLEERVLTAGTGVRLAGGAARGDLALERGERSSDAGGFGESFWRLAVSLTVLGR
jgi:hypothetical protein